MILVSVFLRILRFFFNPLAFVGFHHSRFLFLKLSLGNSIPINDPCINIIYIYIYSLFCLLCAPLLMCHDENLSFGQLIPQFRKSDYLLTCQSITCGLGERPITPPPPPPPRQNTDQLFVDMIDRTGTLESSFIMLLCNTTDVVLITLGFMTLGVWHERDIGIVGAETTAVVLITLGFMTLQSLAWAR